MLIHIERLTLTTSSGSASGNTTSKLRGICYEILVKPATASTQYDISIVNNNGLTIYARTSEVGDMGENMELPMQGANTVSLSNATADELFIIELVMRER